MLGTRYYQIAENRQRAMTNNKMVVGDKNIK
jgi:hypothetical protein